jgi:hypothetical protein
MFLRNRNRGNGIENDPFLFDVEVFNTGTMVSAFPIAKPLSFSCAGFFKERLRDISDLSGNRLPCEI